MQWKMLHDSGTTAEQQVVTLARGGTVEVQITGTCLTEQVLRDGTAYLHGFRVLVEQPHQLFATHP